MSKRMNATDSLATKDTDAGDDDGDGAGDDDGDDAGDDADMYMSNLLTLRPVHKRNIGRASGLQSSYLLTQQVLVRVHVPDYINFDDITSIAKELLPQNTVAEAILLGKTLASPVINQGACGSCWAVSLAGVISDRAMVAAYIDFIRAAATEQSLDPSQVPTFARAVDVCDNQELAASPSHILRHMTDMYDRQTQNLKTLAATHEFEQGGNTTPGWQCCGGLSAWWNPDTREWEDGVIDLFEGGVVTLAACPYNVGPDPVDGCIGSGWLPAAGGPRQVCNNPDAEGLTRTLKTGRFCQEDNAQSRFLVDSISGYIPAEKIPQALLGLGDYTTQGPGSLTTSYMVPQYFARFGKDEAWSPVDKSKWQADHPGATRQFSHVYCYPGHRGMQATGGHAVAIVGYVHNVWADTINQYVDAYIVRNSWYQGGRLWGDDGYFLWATSFSWGPNQQFGMDNMANGQDTVATSFRARRVGKGAVYGKGVLYGGSVDATTTSPLPKSNTTRLWVVLLVLVVVVVVVVTSRKG